jgi:uncharacterized protein HemX
MERAMALMRFLFALLLGFILGAGTVVWLVHSGTGDLFLQRTAVVQDLERRLHDVELQRDQLSRTLEDMNARSQRMEQAFTTLERRFHELEAGRAAE